jgi:hypothetical protein
LILLVVRTDFISEFFAIIDIFPMASLSVTASSDEARDLPSDWNVVLL